MLWIEAHWRPFTITALLFLWGLLIWNAPAVVLEDYLPFHMGGIKYEWLKF